jgi:hypothetical protein
MMETTVTFLEAVDGASALEKGVTYMGALQHRSAYPDIGAVRYFVSLQRCTRDLGPLLLLSEFPVLHIRPQCITIRANHCIPDIDERIDDFLHLPLHLTEHLDILGIYQEIVGHFATISPTAPEGT